MRLMATSIKINFIYNAAYQILVIIIPLITTPYLARTIGANGTGIYSYNASIASYFSMFILLGLNNYGSRSIARVQKNKETRSTVFWNLYCMQIICGITSLLFYLAYCGKFAKDKTAAYMFLLYVSSSALDVTWFFSGLEQFRLITIRNAIIKILTVCSILFFVKTVNDVYIYLFIYSFGSLLSQMIMFMYLFKYVTKPPIIHVKEVISNLKPNIELFIPVIAISLYKVMDKIMLGSMKGTLVVGYYESCERVLNVPMAFITALGVVMLPRMSLIYSSERVSNKANRYIQKSLNFVMLLSTSISFGIMAVANEFVPIFYGIGFEPCIQIFMAIMPCTMFMAFANVIRTQYLIPQGFNKEYIISIISGACVNLIFNFITIPMYGAIGAAISTVLAEATVCALQCVFVRNAFNIFDLIRDNMEFVLYGLFMFIIVYNIHLSGIMGLFYKIVIGTCIYSFLLCTVGRNKIIGLKI